MDIKNKRGHECLTLMASPDVSSGGRQAAHNTKP
jgi:hypothetical protein